MVFSLFKKQETDDEKRLRLNKEFTDAFQKFLANSSVDIRNRYQNFVSGGYDFADTLHQIYDDFGYPQSLVFSNYWNMYRRFGVATAVCEVPVDFCWLDTPTVTGGAGFDSQFEELVSRTKLWKRLRGLDNRQRVGRYAGLFVRVKDNKAPTDPLESLNGIESVVSLTPMYEGQLEVSQTDQDITSERYGMPLIYRFNASAEGNRNEKERSSFNIHWTRVITAAEGADDGSIYGKSALENIYNDLMDLRKISGAGGEGFYQNTRNSPTITAKEGYEMPSGDSLTATEKELDEFLNKWRKRFISEGLEFEYHDVSLDNPKEFAQTSRDNIAAGSKIPNKLIFGTQTGVKAADEDTSNFLTSMNSRRESFLNEMIENTIEWFVTYNVLTAPAELEIEWPDLLERSDTEKADLSKTMAETNEIQFKAGGGHIYTEEQIAEAGGYELEVVDEPDETLDEDEDVTVEPDGEE